MTLTHLAILLGAIATTLGTSVLNGLFGSSKRAQAVTALVLSLILGVAAAAQQGALDNLGWHSIDKVAYAAGVVYTASQVAFHGIWKPTNGASWLETLVGPRAAAAISRDVALAKLIGQEVAAALAAQKAIASSAAPVVVASPPPAAAPTVPVVTQSPLTTSTISSATAVPATPPTG